MAGIIEKKALETADEVAQRLGYYIVGAEYKKEGDDKVLRIFADKENGIGIDECEIFSRAFEEELDKLNIINEAYILEVSSPGVDRILKTEREFRYYIGREVEIKLYNTIDNRKEFKAVIKGYNDGEVTVEADGEDIKIPVKDAAYIRLYFEF